MFDLFSVEGKFKYFFAALSGWTIIFLIVNNYLNLPSWISKKNSNDMKNRIVSIMHGLFAFSFTGFHIYNDNPSLTQTSTEIQHFIMITSCAYFVYDTVACHYYGLTDLSLYLHHGMCIFGSLYAEYIDNSSIPISNVGLFWAEVSNAPMHVRVILRTMKMRYTKLFEFAETFYIITYIICRGIFASSLAYNAVPNSEASIILRLCCLGIWLQSLYFIYEMFFIVLKKLKQYKERKQKKIEYYWFSDHPKLSELSYFNAEGKQKIF